ncbi:SHSP domain-containing protein [Trichostrongylus colubriformis]|uniref:SHSP domain-containing protein n=1 Tax=Trichostrongylus colubriformis TaxID=6319 RepID=A0AAN8IJP5_TRICO
MDLWAQMMHRMMNDYLRDFNSFERSLRPYWRHADHSVMSVANETQQVVDDDQKFAVSIDVSQFHPEELKVNLDGRELIIEGKQQHKSDNSYMERSFLRKWTLPETVNLEAVRTQLSDAGHLSIEAPKVTAASTQRRTIPIERAPSQH